MATNKRLTGHTRYRTGLFGKMILQVEEKANIECPHMFDLSPDFTYWRDAKTTDITQMEYKNNAYK